MARPVKLNKAQQKALDLDHNVAVRAVAGSGKTTVLVNRYLAILDANPEFTPAHILAITFNDAAASHLRSKIREKLSARTGSTRWRDLCRDLADAPISTIHGFCARLLRDYPVEANIDPDFDVLDPIDAAIMLRDSVNTTFRRVRQGTPLYESVLTLTSNLARRPDRKIANLINRREVLAPLVDRYAAMSDEQMFEEAKTISRDAVTSFWNAAAETDLVKLINELVKFVPFAGGEAGAALERIRGIAQKIDMDKTDPVAGSALIQSLASVFLTSGATPTPRKRFFGKKGDWTDTDHYQQCRELFPDVAQIVATLGPNEIVPFIPGVERLYIETTRALLDVYSACLDRYTQMKRSQHALDFCDLQQNCADLLETYSHVRRSLSARYPHILVDEFQDTNSLQWRIITRLAQDPTTGELRPKGLFVVGDEAQSIYGFRNAEVEVFQNVRETIRNINGTNDIESCQNFRSAPRVIEAINMLFSDNEDCIPLETFRNKIKGTVEVIVADSDEKLKSVEQCAVEAELVASRIVAATRSGSMTIPVEGSKNTEKQADFGDIAVLLRSRTHMSAVLDAFKRASIPYYTPSGTGFFSQQEVWDVLTAIRCIAIPDDETALAGYLRSPMVGISDETLFAVSLEPGHSFFEKLRGFADKPSGRPEPAIIADTLDRLDRWRRYAGRVNTHDLIRRICDDTGIWASFESEPGAPQPAENVERLIDIARTFSVRKGRDLRAFLDRMDFLVDNEWQQPEATVADQAAHAVAVMTVHAAKGLEFPVVIVMQCHRKYNLGQGDTVHMHKDKGFGFKTPDPDDNFVKVGTSTYSKVRNAVISETLREEMRLLHVACTRARDALIVSGFGAKPKSGSWWTHILNKMPADASPAVYRTATDFDKTDFVGANLPSSPDPTLYDSIESLACTSKPKTKNVSAETMRIVNGIERINAVRRPVNLSATQWVMYSGCPRRYFYQYLLGVDEPTVGTGPLRRTDEIHPNALAFGNVVHRAMELYIQYRDVRAAVDRSMTEIAGIEPHIRDTVTEIVDRFIASDTGRAVSEAAETRAEQSFTVRTANTVIQGSIDLLWRGTDGVWHIVDYKTSRTDNTDGSNINQRNRLADRYAPQLDVYALAVRRFISSDAPVTRTLYLTNSPDEPHEYPPFGAAEEKKLVEQIDRAAKLIADEYVGANKFPSATDLHGTQESAAICEECGFVRTNVCVRSE